MLWRHRIRRWQFYSLIETRGPRGPGWRWSRSRISSSDDRIKPRIGDVFGDFHIFISRVQMIQERQRCWPIQISIVPREPRSRCSRCSQGVWRRHDLGIMFQILANCFSWSFFEEGVRRSFKAVWSPAEIDGRPCLLKEIGLSQVLFWIHFCSIIGNFGSLVNISFQK